MDTTKSKWHSAGWWAAVGGIAAVIGVVVAVIAYVRPSGTTDGTPLGDGSGPSGASSTTTPFMTTAPSSASSSRTRPGVDGEMTTGESGPARYYLSEIDYVEVEIERGGGCTGGCAGFTKDSAKIGATTYPQSFITRMDGGGNRSVSTWNSLRSCDSFEAYLGLTNDSDTSTATFTISKDGGPAEVLAAVTTGDVAHVSTNMSGVNRFTLAAYVSGVETERAKAVWGDALLTCSAGSLD